MALKSIQTRILLWSGIALLATVFIISGYSAYSSRSAASKAAMEKSLSFAKENAAELKATVEVALDTARTLSDVLSSVKKEGEGGVNLDRDQVNAILRATLEKHPEFLGVYTLWEPNAFDELDELYINEKGHDDTGRLIPYWYRAGGEIKLAPLEAYESEKRGPTGVREGEYYLAPRESGKECVIDPYPYDVGDRRMMITSTVVPVMADGKFYGIAGVDLALDILQAQAQAFDQYEGQGNLGVISHNGTLVAVSKRPELIGKPAVQLHSDFADEIGRIQAGQSWVEVADEEVEAFAPVVFGSAERPWSVNVTAPMDVILAEADRAVKWQVLIGAACAVAALLVLWWVARSVARPLVEGAEHLERVAAKGDLSRNIADGYLQRQDEVGRLARAIRSLLDFQKSELEMARKLAAGEWTAQVPVRSAQDELGKAFQEMVTQVSSALAAVNDSAGQVNAGAYEISDASQSLSQGATEQAASLQEITSSMTEIGSQTKQNAENAQQANLLATAARDSAEKGNTRMHEMVASMDEITDSSQQISKIIKTIDDIAFQTNLLALNAAVEAARAGQHGKGFAVVAEEVRNLAGRSAKAARETAELIESSNARVEKGTDIANQTAEALTEIVESITRAADLVGEIAAASNEQAQGISQVSQGLSQIDSVTQQNTANAEETASAAQELSGQAKGLQNLLSRFKLNKGGYAATPSRTASSPAEEPPRQISAPAPSREGWGVAPASPASGGGRMVDPQVEINLDDDDFGKY